VAQAAVPSTVDRPSPLPFIPPAEQVPCSDGRIRPSGGNRNSVSGEVHGNFAACPV